MTLQKAPAVGGRYRCRCNFEGGGPSKLRISETGAREKLAEGVDYFAGGVGSGSAG
jgi:hypothetical protein